MIVTFWIVVVNGTGGSVLVGESVSCMGCSQDNASLLLADIFWHVIFRGIKMGP